jgi:hypothetical protein
MKLIECVETNDIAMLNEWLRSPVAEIQVYAIDGFSQLRKQGYKLSEEQRRLIKFIKKKKGNINTCSGCLFSSKTISSVTRRL